MVNILLNGRSVVSVAAYNGTEPKTEVLTIPPQRVFELGTAVSHTVTAMTQDGRDGAASGNTGGHFTINAVSIDVVGLK
jgi:hypothetical protein